MRCCVPFCKNTSDNVSTSQAEEKGISFHSFPSDAHLRAAWLRALGKQDSHLPDSAVVCSQHFLNDDIYETKNSSRQIVTGAIPSTVQVCMICLDTDSKLFLMSTHKLGEAYEKLTGHPPHDQGNLKQTVCIQCAQRLINFSRFKDKSLRARALMMDLVEKHELITRRHIKMINRTKHQLKSNMVLTTLGLDHCDLHILEHPSENKQRELEEIHHRGVVKTEESDDSMSVDIDMEVINENDNNINDFAEDPLKYESAPSLCFEEFVHEQADPSPSARAAQTSVAPLFTNLAIKNEIEVPSTEEGDTKLSCKLYDVIKVVPRQDRSLMKGHNAVRSSVTDTDTVKVIVSKSLQRKTDCLNSIVSLQHNKTTKSSARSEKIFICDICQKMFKQKNILVQHLKIHSIIKSFSCALCEYKCTRNSKLILHMRTHTGERPFICKICNYRFAENSKLVRHIRIHSGEKSYSCKICQFKCVEKSYLDRHMKTHTGEKPYSCKICEYKCAVKSYLVMHMRTHTGEKPYSCKICNSKFAQKAALVCHMRTHTGEKPYSCKICNSKFAQKGGLVYHMKTHTGEKPYSCKICEYKCAVKSYLVMHMRTHTGEKPYSCKICNSKFAQKGGLVYHMRTHTGEKPYSCKICYEIFAHNCTLVTHMRTHTGEKPFICKICNYQFVENSKLLRHMRTHTGEKPYSCKICKYKCADKSNLDRHVKIHTGEKSFTCKTCNYKCSRNSQLVKHTRTH